MAESTPSLSLQPTLQLQFEAHGYKVFTPVNASEYHVSRYVEAMRYNTYATAGITEENLNAACDEMITRCNDEKKIKTLRTDIAAIANAIKYCTKYPVDQHSAIRIGSVLSFIEYEKEGITVSENPDKPDAFFQAKKEQLAFDFPEFYTFFLSWGITNCPKYNELSEALTDTAYFDKRRRAIAALLPADLPGFKKE